MKIVITQPTFLPWLGYFDQLRIADVVVFLDSVQFARRSWQNRNRIINRKGEEILITLPIKKVPRETPIKEINVSDSFCFSKFLRMIKDSYKNTNYSRECLELIEKSFSKNIYKKDIFLRDINRQFIEDILENSAIGCKIFWSSDIENQISYNTPSERLLEICKFFNANIYISAPGAKDYMKPELVKFAKEGILVKWHSFVNYSYIIGNSFTPYMSVIDYISHNPINTLSTYLQKCSKF